TADHVPPYDEVIGPPGRVGALCEEDPIEVAVIGSRAARRRKRIARGAGSSHQRAERAVQLTGPSLPVEAVALSLGAVEPLPVFEKPLTSGIVFALSIDVGQAHLDRGELVFADPPIEKLVVSSVGIPEPARAVRQQWERERDDIG